MILKVKVTKKDIMGGGHQANRCPIQRAISRVYDGSISVCQHSIDLEEVCFATPKKIGRWIVRYDNKGKVAPVSFTLKTPGLASKA